MTIIDRYITREILLAWIAVLIVLLTIVSSTEVVHLLSWISEGIIPVSAFLAYLINSLFDFSVVLIPLSLLMGILLGFGRLYKDSEMTAMLASGIGPWQWYRPLLTVAIPAVLLLLFLSLFVRPLIVQQRAELAAKVKSRAEVDTLLVGQFNRAGKGAVLFLESENKHKNQRKNAFLQQSVNDTQHVDIAASTRSFTSQDGHRYMVMENGINYDAKVGNAAMKITRYREYGVHLENKQVQAHLGATSKSLSALWHSKDIYDKAELQWRFASPIATLIVSIMALPLSHTNPRSGRYSKLALALVLYLIYSNLLGIAYTKIVQEKIPVWIGLWWVHLIALFAMYFLLKYYGYFKRYKPVVHYGA